MTDKDNLSRGRVVRLDPAQDCVELGKFAGDGACGDILTIVCNRIAEGLESTVWDIHKESGAPLHEAFAALRTLEYAKVIEIRDHPSDPFGATIALLEDGIANLRKRALR